ncbi:hypothetical protein FBALC1_10567 [Flavobacteriales bacterium ALC-1]|nr:hypothetical protein FBALC1_10567 [Flavobacteriales bacterium ALC-1]
MFILFTIIGTLSHELGHAAVANFLGYDTKVSYSSMSWNHSGFDNDEDVKKMQRLTKGYLNIDYDEWPVELKLNLERLGKKVIKKYPYNKSHDLLITIGGPAQTIFTSFIGLVILYFRRKEWKIDFKITDWLAVFMSLFILREIFNFISTSFSSLIHSKTNFNGDEYRISVMLGYNEWLIPFLTLLLSLTISYYVFFKIIPIKYRFTFIVSGLIGGVSGFAIWFGFLGKVIFNSQL